MGNELSRKRIGARPGTSRKSGRRPEGLIGRRADEGSVTAELAVGLPAVILLMLAALTAVSAVITKLECVDAARQAARAAARGDSGTVAGGRAAPSGASVAVDTSGGRVRATVRAPVRPLGAHLPTFTVSADAVAEPEPGAPE